MKTLNIPANWRLFLACVGFFLTSLSAAHAQCTRNCGIPTASLTANGLHNLTVGVGSMIAYDWSSAGAVSATSSYTVDSGGPNSWDANTLGGSLSGTIGASQVGHTYVITYTVTDSTGQTASDQVTITVVSSLTASLTANGLHNLTVGVGSTIAYDWSSAYAVSATSSYTVDGGGPNSWDANTLSGSLSGTIGASQVRHTYVITYTVTNSTGQTASDQVTITVVSSLTASLTANGLHNLTVGAGSTIAYDWSSAYAASAASSYTVDGGGPNPWDANSLSGGVSGTVAASEVGHTYAITYTVTNSTGQTASDQVTITAVDLTSATHLSVTAPATATTGTAFNFTVTALDASNHVATSYSGTVHFTSTDSQATLPTNSNLSNGTATFSATLKTSGSQTITATDTVTPSITGQSGTINVFSGTGTTATLSPTSLNFGLVVLGASLTKTVTLTNVGATTMSITGFAITGTNAGDFAQSHTCGSSLGAGTSCSISVTFKPSASGMRTATLSVSDNAASSPQTVALSGGCIPQGGQCFGPNHNCCPAPFPHHSFCSNPTGFGTCVED
jgi:hypothetical protein